MIRFNEVVPLVLQVYDGKEDLEVLVNVLNAEQETVFSGVLPSIGRGLYQSDEFKMPMTDFVVAQYLIYDGGKESEDYERVSEVFNRDKQDVQAIVAGGVQETLQGVAQILNDDFIQGVMSQETHDEFIEGVLSWNL